MMTNKIPLLIAVFLFLCVLPLKAQEKPKIETPKKEKKIRELLREESIKKVREALRRGFDFLVKSQDAKLGCWGSHDPCILDSSQLGFGLLKLGCQDSLTAACTSLCTRALLDYKDKNEKDMEAQKKGIAYLLDHHKFAIDPDVGGGGGCAFNTWGYIYTLEFMVDLYGREEGKAHIDTLKEIIPEMISELKKLQFFEGGWGYYTGVNKEGNSTSFTTANALLSLSKAKEAGFEIPKGVMEDGTRILKKMRWKNGDAMYGYYLRDNGGHALETLSAGARTAIVNLALHSVKDEGIRDKEMKYAVEEFFRNEDYLEIGRKRIIPHRDAPQNISGYFFFYGYKYVGDILLQQPDDFQNKYLEKFAYGILRTQEEENGSWWDTICYNYGDKWGTGFALICLEQYLTCIDNQQRAGNLEK